MQDLKIWRRQLSPLPTCAVGCAGDLPVVASSNCAPLVLESEIRRIFIAKRTASPFSDWADPGEWESRLDDSSIVGDDYIRTLVVIGDKPAPSSTKKDLSNRRKKNVTKAHVVNFTIDDVQPEIHDFVRGMECGGEYRFWYETHGGLMLGGNSGIFAGFQADMVLARGVDEHMVYNGTAEWSAKFTEERIESPIFNYGSAETANYDTVVKVDASATPAAANGITVVSPATDATKQFQYIALSPTVGSNMTMILQVATVLALTITFKSDYLGTTFKFIDATGDSHYGVFTNGTINFV